MSRNLFHFYIIFMTRGFTIHIPGGTKRAATFRASINICLFSDILIVRWPVFLSSLKYFPFRMVSQPKCNPVKPLLVSQDLNVILSNNKVSLHL